MIQTTHLTLCAITRADCAPLYAIQRDPVAMQYTYTATTLAEFTEHLAAYMALASSHGYAPWTISERATGQICGWGGLTVDPFAPGWGVEILYFLAPSVWGRGYATELTNAALAYGFTQFDLPAIGAFAHPDHRASTRVLEKCGLQLLRYEPRLGRNFYEITQAQWQRLALGATPMLPHA